MPPCLLCLVSHHCLCCFSYRAHLFFGCVFGSILLPKASHLQSLLLAWSPPFLLSLPLQTSFSIFSFAVPHSLFLLTLTSCLLFFPLLRFLSFSPRSLSPFSSIFFCKSSIAVTCFSSPSRFSLVSVVVALPCLPLCSSFCAFCLPRESFVTTHSKLLRSVKENNNSNETRSQRSVLSKDESQSKRLTRVYVQNRNDSIQRTHSSDQSREKGEEDRPTRKKRQCSIMS